MKIALAVLCYLIGSLPTGYLVFRFGGRGDIRDFGSGATGATNVLRLKGWRAALPVALIDIAKGFVPSFLILRLYHDPVLAAGCASLSVLGHCFPVYIGFRGGKGVATAAGAMFAIAPLPALASLGVFAAAIASTRIVSLGSLLAALLFPAFMTVFGLAGPVIAASVPILIIILARHSGNIGRIFRGTERKLGQKEVGPS
jgi:acyl phosphate:glycerol-3-phosphate acyltransferase